MIKKGLYSTELDSTKRVKRKITLQEILTRGEIRRRWSQAYLAHKQPLSSRTRNPSNLPSHLLLSLHLSRPLGLPYWSSDYYYSSCASCKKTPPSSPSCSFISTWSIIKMVLLFVRGTFQPDSLVVEDKHVLQVRAWKTCAKMSAIYLFVYLFIYIWGIPQQGIGLPWSRCSPNNVYDMHEQVMPVLVNARECKRLGSVMLKVRKGREHGSCC